MLALDLITTPEHLLFYSFLIFFSAEIALLDKGNEVLVSLAQS